MAPSWPSTFPQVESTQRVGDEVESKKYLIRGTIYDDKKTEKRGLLSTPDNH